MESRPSSIILNLRVEREDNSRFNYPLLENHLILSSQHAKTVGDDAIVKLLSTLSSHQSTPFYYPVAFSDALPNDCFIVGASLRYKLGYRLKQSISLEFYPANAYQLFQLDKIELTIKRVIPYSRDNPILIDYPSYIALIYNRLSLHLISNDQPLYFPIDKEKCLEVVVTDMALNYPVNGQQQPALDIPVVCKRGEFTSITLSKDPNLSNVILQNMPALENKSGIQDTAELLDVRASNNVQQLQDVEAPERDIDVGDPPVFHLDLKMKNVGGHKHVIERLIREAFYTRLAGRDATNAYGVTHTKGILLSGPPGTGKTLIAREIGQAFSKDHVKIVNGPELKNAYVGQSAANVRRVFADAISDWHRLGVNSPVHVIIFDEIDVLCPKRGSRVNGSGADEDIVAQLLTLLDGVDSPQNMIVIGLTNRKDLIDPALLRPGRLEVHIDISLPTQEERLEILELKTSAMRDNALLSNEVDLDHWASRTKHFTGAELELLVKKAAQYAIKNNLRWDEGSASLLSEDMTTWQPVTPNHFELAYVEIKPMFGMKPDAMPLPHFVVFDEHIQAIINTFKNWCDASMLSYGGLLLYGEKNVGKSVLARQLAALSGAQCVRTISAAALLGLSLPQQLSLFDDELTLLTQSDHSVCILDDVEGVLSADAELKSYNNALRIKLDAFTKELAEKAQHCFVIATTSSKQFIEQVKLLAHFNETAVVSNVSLTNLYSPVSRSCLSAICESLGIRLEVDVSQDSLAPVGIAAPIGDLVYYIKKNAIFQENKPVLALSSLIRALKEHGQLVNGDVDQVASLLSEANHASFFGFGLSGSY